ncbi:hypothetical protein A2U01_0012699, partial [Trifolium medium]|nr:hypothetical protein [Trifolium medium]
MNKVQMIIPKCVLQALFRVFGAATMLFSGTTSLSMLPKFVYSHITPYMTTIADECFDIGICLRDNFDTLVQAGTLCFPDSAPAIQ